MKVALSISLAALALGAAGGYWIGRRSPSPEPVRTPRRPLPAASTTDEKPHAQDVPSRESPSESGGLETALLRFRECVGTDESERLAVALGSVRDPAVEALALELIHSGILERQLAGLDLLDRLDLENPETRQIVLNLLRSDSRPEILSGALYALHPCVTDPRETRDIIGVLQPLSAHPEAEVRRRSVIALVQWGAIEPAIRALEDATPDVRAGAAFALGQARTEPTRIVEALASRVRDDREDWAVREQAWRSLARFPLDERLYEIYRQFREQHEAAGEASENVVR